MHGPYNTKDFIVTRGFFEFIGTLRKFLSAVAIGSALGQPPKLSFAIEKLLQRKINRHQDNAQGFTLCERSS